MNKLPLPNKDDALVGRNEVMQVSEPHTIFERPLSADDIPEGYEKIQFGMGCFWGAERRFWQQPDVWLTAVGYAGGGTKNPSYEEVCSGRTAHAEVVLVVYKAGALEQLLRVFWESHHPAEGMRQGNDVGTQYRSAIYYETAEQGELVHASHSAYEKRLLAAGYKDITTELAQSVHFYFAESYHQQYLDKNPAGYCGLKGTGVSCS